MPKANKRGALSSTASTALSELASEGKRVFSLGDFASAMGWPRVRASKLLHELQRSGWVTRLAQGTYLIVPLEAGPEAAWSEDSLVVAGHLAGSAAVAYWSACHYWNWTEQAPRTVFVQTMHRIRHGARSVLGVRYRFVRVQPGKFFGTVKRNVGDGVIIITDREKTLVDALDRPDLCGGIAQVAAMLPAAGRSVDWNKLDEYLKRLGSGAIYKRLGFMVEHVGRKLRVPDRAGRIKAWQVRLTGGHASLEPHRPAKGPVSRRWRLRVNVAGFKGDSVK